MSDNKYFVDINNLNRFWSNAKEYIDNNVSKIQVKTITSPYIILDKQLQPNIVYEIIGVKRQINIRIKDPEKNYIFRFVSGYEPTILTLFGDICWENNKYPEIKKYTKYTINISNGIAYIMSTETSLEKQYLTFEVLSESSFSFSENNIDYSLDGGSTWTTLTAGSSTPTIAAKSKIMWRGNVKSVYSDTDWDYFSGTFSSTGYYNVEGNIMSLLYGDDFVDKTSMLSGSGTFKRLFYNSVNLLHAYKLILPAINLLHTNGRNCYDSMFDGCKSLTSAPELPATTLVYGCYSHMFDGCKSLTSAPKLPAITLADHCYSYMFNNCVSLTTTPELPATTLATQCYESMFCSCSSLTSAPELPATTLTYSCYMGMFRDCKSLTTSPKLPATTLATQCYRNMFSSCSSLTSAPALPATTLARSCYYSMFSGCKSLTSAPELPATTLTNSCYSGMFQICSSLNSITMLATDISATGCLTDWVNGVASTGTFTKAASMTSLPTGASGIPSGWTVVDK